MRFFLILAVVLAIFARIKAVIDSPFPTLEKDAGVYDQLARGFLKTGVLGMGDRRPAAWFMPGYPLFLAGIYKIFGVGNFDAVRIIQQLMSMITALILGKIAKSRLATILALIYPPFVYTANLLLTETLFSFLAVVCLYLWQTKSRWLGMGLGLATLVRPTLFVLLPFVPKAIVGFVLVMSPWWVRNYSATDHFVPFSLQAGEVLLGGTYYDYKFDPADWPGTGLEWEINQTRTQLAIDRIKNQLTYEPIKWTGWQLKKIWLLWSAPFYNGGGYKAVLVFHWTILFLGILAMKKNWRLGLVLGVLTIFQAGTVGLDRYNLPLMYGVIVVASGLWAS